MPQGRTFTNTYSHHGQGTLEGSRGSEALTLRGVEALRHWWPVHTSSMDKAHNSKETPDFSLAPYYGFSLVLDQLVLGGPSQSRGWKHSAVQSFSRVRPIATPWTAACQASLSITNSWSLFKLMSMQWVMLSKNLILCRPLLLLPSVFPSIGVFSNESVLLIRWPKYWSFSVNLSPTNEHPGLISFRMDWLDSLAVQRTLKSLL